MTDEFHLSTGGTAQWPPIPSQWSYSSLRDAEECPRRWALSRASYPSIWERQGYPPRPALAALVGDVVHLVLERVLRALQHRSVDDESGVAALRQLGGYTSLVRSAIDEQLGALTHNPRMSPRLDS